MIVGGEGRVGEGDPYRPRWHRLSSPDSEKVTRTQLLHLNIIYSIILIIIIIISS